MNTNKALVQDFIEEVLVRGKLDRIAEYCLPGSLLAGGLAGQFTVIRTAFPDLRYSIDSLLAEGDQVIVRSTMQATHSGPLMGLPVFGKLQTPILPSGRTIVVTAIAIYTLKDGRILSVAQEFDQIGMLLQMGWTITPPEGISQEARMAAD